MKGDKECEDHKCEALPYCSWHPDECMGKPWAKEKRKVKIPFLERFREPMILDRKTWTSRTRCYGRAGDVFEVFGHEFEIVTVERRTVDDIMDHWQEEGCNSREDAQEVWSKLHPRRHDPQQRMFTHVFKRIK